MDLKHTENGKKRLKDFTTVCVLWLSMLMVGLCKDLKTFSCHLLEGDGNDSGNVCKTCDSDQKIPWNNGYGIFHIDMTCKTKLARADINPSVEEHTVVIKLDIVKNEWGTCKWCHCATHEGSITSIMMKKMTNRTVKLKYCYNSSIYHDMEIIFAYTLHNLSHKAHFLDFEQCRKNITIDHACFVCLGNFFTTSTTLSNNTMQSTTVVTKDLTISDDTSTVSPEIPTLVISSRVSDHQTTNDVMKNICPRDDSYTKMMEINRTVHVASSSKIDTTDAATTTVIDTDHTFTKMMEINRTVHVASSSKIHTTNAATTTVIDTDHAFTKMKEINSTVHVTSSSKIDTTDAATATVIDTDNTITSEKVFESTTLSSATKYQREKFQKCNEGCNEGDENCKYICEFQVKPQLPNMTADELKEEVKKLKSELQVEKSNLSLIIRRKISVGDDRPSAIGIGALGITVIVVVVLTIVSPDVINLVHFMQWRRKLKTVSPKETDSEKQSLTVEETPL